VSLPEGYAERLLARLREEAKKSYEDKNARIDKKYEEYKGKIEERLEEAAKTFAEKVKG